MEDKLYIEIEKAKEVVRGALNLYRSGVKLESAVKEAEAIADIAFKRAYEIAGK